MEEEEIVEIILRESKKIQDVLNNGFLNKFVKLHGVNSKYNFLKLKQEMVAKKAYFLDVKKKYALWVVNEEGVPVQKPVLKGIVTRRSDYSSCTKEGINELIRLLIKEEKVSFKKIREYKEEMTEKVDSLIRSGDKRIARPVAFTKPLRQYKVIPSHVHGMLLWNELVYEYFAPGTRGYQFKIKGVDPYKMPESVKRKISYFDLKKHNNIVVPGEEERLPDYFIINYDASMKFVWEDRVNEFLSPIMDRIDKRQKIKLLTF